MLSRLKYGLWAVSLLAGLAGSAPAVAADEEKSMLDQFNIGLDFRKFCSLQDDAPIGDKCWAFLAAVIEIEKGYVSLDPQVAKRLNHACLPPRMSIQQIFATIRPQLRRIMGSCVGLCDSTSYVMSSLAGTFPCEAEMDFPVRASEPSEQQTEPQDTAPPLQHPVPQP
jgi:hypothetical protein